jgi:hypothetical protein
LKVWKITREDSASYSLLALTADDARAAIGWANVAKYHAVEVDLDVVFCLSRNDGHLVSIHRTHDGALAALKALQAGDYYMDETIEIEEVKP